MNASPGNLVRERGDRLCPGRFHTRYQTLTLLADKLRRILDSDLLPPGERLLDYGCGSQPYRSLFTRKFSHYVGADFPRNDRAELTIGPRGTLPVEDAVFDCVLSTQVLEHVEDPRTYLGEAHRVLRPEGSLVLSTHGVWRYHPDPGDYWRWTIDGLQLELSRAGFDVWWVQSIFGMASCSIQLWQDASMERLPRWIRPVYVWMLQSLIGLIERRKQDGLSYDALIYVVLGRKSVCARIA